MDEQNSTNNTASNPADNTDSNKATSRGDDSGNKTGGLSKPVLVTLIVLGALVVGGLGYMFGTSAGEDNAAAEYQQQIEATEQDINTAKDVAGNEIDESQENIETLQAENAQLKETIEEQNDKIADLEEQLAEAESTEDPQSQE